MEKGQETKSDTAIGLDMVTIVPSSKTEHKDNRGAADPPKEESMFDFPSVSNRHGHPGISQKTIVSGAENAQNSPPSPQSNYFALFLVLSYVAVSVIVYHFAEKWSVVDSIYFAMVIVTTVGYGDVVPTTTAGRAFTIFFAFYGIVTIGVALGQLASWFIERQKSISKLATKRLLRNVDDAAATSSSTTALPMDKEKALAVGVTTNEKKHGRVYEHQWAHWQHVIFSDSNKAIMWALVPIIVSIIGGLILGVIEGWSALDCFYYTIITITTVGFGDLSPHSQGGRIFAIFYLPLAVVGVAHGIGSILNELSARAVMKTKISMKELLAMDADGDGKVSQLEYVCYMLVKLNKADQDDLDGIIAQFHKLDKDGSGELDRDDLERLDRELQRQNEEHDE